MSDTQRIKSPPKVVLIIDDEPVYLQWLQDYIESRGYTVEWATTVDEGLSNAVFGNFSAVIVDLNIPASEAIAPQLAQRGGVYRQYPGLLAAHVVRDRGFKNTQVVIYSGYDVPEVAKIASVLGTSYVNKEQPDQFKKSLNVMLPKIS